MPRDSGHRPRNGRFGLRPIPVKYICVGVWGYKLREYKVDFVKVAVEESVSRVFYEEPTFIRTIIDSEIPPRRRIMRVYVGRAVMICRRNDGKTWISEFRVPYHEYKKFRQGEKIRAKKAKYRADQIRKRKVDYPDA